MLRLLAVWALLGWTSLAGADDLFEGLIPGLLGRYSDGAVERQRVDADVAFDWQSASPFSEFANEPFTAKWSGVMLVRSDTDYIFSTFAAGEVEITIDGKQVLKGTRETPGWIHGPETALEFGFLPVTISYRKTSAAAACKLYWASRLFPREPLPHHLLFHEEDDSQARLVERGRVLFDAHRCNRCHIRGDSLPSAEGPPFIAIAADINPDWIVAKLRHRHPEAADSKMPSFAYNEEEATAIGAWLWAINQPPRIVPLREEKPDKKNPTPDGLTLVRSLGCLACHKLGEEGSSSPYGGGDLSHVGGKRTADWLYTWLLQPDRINPERTMPHFKLSPIERSHIAASLARLGHQEGTSYERPQYDNNTQVVQRGRDLVRQARCFNCHKTPAVEVDTRGLPKLDQPVQDWSKSCLAEHPDRESGRPCYPQADVAALRAYVEFLTSTPLDPQDLRTPQERSGASNHGRLVLERRNCLACHERDGAKGIVETAGQMANTHESLRGLSEALIPPNLTAVGDKLQDEALLRAIDGDPDPIRLPWLRVRMPKFNHSDADREALAAYLIGHDRIPQPDNATDTTTEQVAQAGEVDSETLLLGRQLVGAGGFSCIACHSVGKYEPRNTALGTRGSDLKGLGRRVREDYYYRWTRAPLRIVPGMEMPSYEERPVKGVLDGDVHAQLTALWSALNDPRFEAPTNPSQVEQLLTVRPGDPPRIVRDVFTVSAENGGGVVPRAFAIGFDNGHSILFDLDRGCLRDWTFGDFARQRTEGKSWYWDLAGAAVMQGLSPRSEFVLKRNEGWSAISTDHPDQYPQLQAFSVEQRGDSQVASLSYSLIVPGDHGGRIHLLESWAVDAVPSGQTALVRSVTCIGTSVPGQLYCVPVSGDSRLLDAAIDLGADATDCGDFGRGVRVPVVSSPQSPNREGAALDAGTIRYTARVGSRSGDSQPRPEFPQNASPVTTAPGFEGMRLDVPASMMPTALAPLPDGALAVTSLKGDVLLLRDSNRDGLPDSTQPFAAGLAAPFGVLHAEIATNDAPAALSLLVVHKPELIELTDRDGDGVAEEQRVRASGWGYTDNYHDWSSGPVRDAEGNLFIATSSDYAQAGRPEELCRWRGKVLRLTPDGEISPIAHELRYPMGIARDPRGRLFVSDQQGVANCFNEINHIVEGARYGVKGLYDPDSDQPEQRAAIQIPHPWTRSVNGIFFIPPAGAGDEGLSKLAPFAGHGIGCEYNSRFLIRFSLQDVDGQLQGATYLFTRSTWENEAETFLGPMCGAVAPNGDLYIGSIHDSGWL
ncbi:MAG: hypothetical protein KDA75_04900, partial [Planctomycetaceae bacterium]|nr:hypothetical protein [Planctomycetaceae bacterium]